MNEVVVLDVGHGNSCLVRSGDDVVVIDAPLGSSLVEALHEEGVIAVRLALVSHSDADHLGGMISLLLSEDVVVEEVRCNPDAVRTSQFWDDFKVACRWAREHHGTRLRVELTEESTDDISRGDLVLQVLYPSATTALSGVGGKSPTGERLSPNAMSAVIRVQMDGDVVVLLAADITPSALIEIENAGEDLSAPVLVFPHHGGLPGTPNLSTIVDFTTRLMSAVTPSTVIFSISRTRFRNPNPQIVETIRRVSPNTHIACTELSRRCSESDLLTGGYLSTRFAHGRSSGHCCAGSMVLRPGSQGSVEPGRAAHEAAVSVLPARLCK